MKKIIYLSTIFFAFLLALSSCEENLPAPEVVTSTPQVVIPVEGGEYALEYEIVNPRDNGALDVVIPEGNDWLKVTGVSAEAVTLMFSENTGTENRGANITLSYRYGTESVSVVVNVIQEFTICDYRHDIVSAVFNWYGSTGGLNDDMSNFYIQMCDNEDPYAPGACTIFFDLYTSEVPKDNVPIAGVYSPAECGMETDFTYCNYDTFIWEMNADGSGYKYLYGFVAGEIEIVRDGGHLSIRALLTDESGKIHLIRYEGDPEIVDGTVESNLASDWNATVDGSTTEAMAVCYGDAITGTSNTWAFQIWPEECVPKDYVFFGEFYTAKDVNHTTGFPDGMTLVMDEEGAGAPNTYSEGFSGFQGTWLLQVYAVDAVSLTFGAQTPLKDGSISFFLNSDGTYDIKIDAVDDNVEEPHHVNVTFDNIPVSFLDPSEVSGLSKSTSAAIGKPAMKRPR